MSNPVREPDTIATQPLVEPWTVEDIKRQTRLDGDFDLDTMNLAGFAARRAVESHLRLNLIDTVRVFKFSQWPQFDTIWIKWGPIDAAGVTSITYVDNAGAEQTLATSVYDTDIYNRPGRVFLKDSQSWPSIRGDTYGLTINYTAGFGPALTDVPEDIRIAILMLAAHWVRTREAVSDETLKEVPMGYRHLLSRERTVVAR